MVYLIPVEPTQIVSVPGSLDKFVVDPVTQNLRQVFEFGDGSGFFYPVPNIGIPPTQVTR